MTVLGIETSCDETSAAIVRDGTLVSNVTRAQAFHTRYGGVVPELASRAHMTAIAPVVDEALRTASVSLADITGVAAVHGPGLAGSLLVGLTYGKAVAWGKDIPFVAVDHMEGHIVSNLLSDPRPAYPFLNLTVSGGHTQLVRVVGELEYAVLGNTLDDAAGEAYDKVAKMLGLPYPGGPSVQERAGRGNPEAITFPRPRPTGSGYDFSFSGLKTSVLYYLRGKQFDAGHPDEALVNDVCASFQAAANESLVDRLFAAADALAIRNVCIAGGVSANLDLRARAEAAARPKGINLFVPPFEYCTDNAAMIAMAGYQRLTRGMRSSLETTAEPSLSLAAHA